MQSNFAFSENRGNYPKVRDVLEIDEKPLDFLYPMDKSTWEWSFLKRLWTLQVPEKGCISYRNKVIGGWTWCGWTTWPCDTMLYAPAWAGAIWKVTTCLNQPAAYQFCYVWLKHIHTQHMFLKKQHCYTTVKTPIAIPTVDFSVITPIHQPIATKLLMVCFRCLVYRPSTAPILHHLRLHLQLHVSPCLCEDNHEGWMW